MKIHQQEPFSIGYHPITELNGKYREMMMDFGILKISADMEFEDNLPLEGTCQNLSSLFYSICLLFAGIYGILKKRIRRISVLRRQRTVYAVRRVCRQKRS